MSYAGSDTSREDPVSDDSADNSSSESDETDSSSQEKPEADSDVPMDDANDADNEQSSSDNDDSHSVYDSPEEDTEGEIVQCEECHCWLFLPWFSFPFCDKVEMRCLQLIAEGHLICIHLICI
ncbi:hypothetical protein F5Y00DRAFT_242422 [Daldinia vernicosa]|uniref:uncharacterized protein n=1 Tax=Daldinia vernicosa TaxID=114800 RepID=UPI0020084F6B|nr:uncharacterized protein F5Y00DRAFT_242422 [Daldinia vernicosa]KAI0847150.1 hypothetical protein F5Y00DRAFT_242422 [Daldinia vernicosa]